MMLGCSSLADVRASRWNRSTNSLSNARENGRTLIATSRSSCFSRALKTMAIPPRPSSSRISYSSFSCSRTRSSSVTSICWSRTAATGVVCDRSSPQERQNLLASSFWVPQREQYIKSPKGRGNLGICRTKCQLATVPRVLRSRRRVQRDRKSTRLNSSHGYISYAVFCLKKKNKYIYLDKDRIVKFR